MRNLSLKLARWLNGQLNEPVNENDLRFGIENLLIQGILILCMSSIALVFNCIQEMLIFMLSLVAVRSFTGGIHLHRFLHCLLVTHCVCFGCIALTQFLHHPGIYIFLDLLSLGVVWRWAPDMRYKRRKTEQDRQRARRLSRGLTGICSIFSVLELLAINQGMGRILACSLTASAVSLALTQKTVQ